MVDTTEYTQDYRNKDTGEIIHVRRCADGQYRFITSTTDTVSHSIRTRELKNQYKFIGARRLAHRSSERIFLSIGGI